MRDLCDILKDVRAKIAAACERSGRNPDEVEIVAVTKTHGAEVVDEARAAGLTIIGENKVQEAAWKKPASASGPEWHLIGHLQSNKVRHALELFDCIHSVDSAKLAERIDFIADQLRRIVGIAYQHISFLQAIHQPFTEKCRYIGPASGIQYHI